MVRKITVCALILLCLGAASAAWAADESTDAELRLAILDILTDNSIPGATVVAVRNNQVVFQMEAGLATSSPRRLVDDETVYLIASISKTLTITTLLQLIENLPPSLVEKMNLKYPLNCPRDTDLAEWVGCFLDTRIDNFLDFEVKNPHAENVPIRLGQLLEHTSGIIDNGNQGFACPYMVDQPTQPLDESFILKHPMEEFLKYYLTPAGNDKKTSLECLNVNDEGWWASQWSVPMYSEDNFGPHGSYSYSNVGYNLIGYVTEKILERACPLAVGIPLGQACEAAKAQNPEEPPYPMWRYSQHVLLEPLGMTELGPLAGRWRFWELPRDQMARGLGDLPFYAFPGYPSGGFRCTAGALSRFLMMLMNNGTWKDPHGKEHVILSSEVLRDVFDFSDRVLPWVSQNSRGFEIWSSHHESAFRLLVGHEGGEAGVATSMFWLPVPTTRCEDGELCNDVSKSLGVIVLTNSNWPDDYQNIGAPQQILLTVFDYLQGDVTRKRPRSGR